MRISSLLFICIGLISSCSEESDSPAPGPTQVEACFLETVDGGTVTFNSSCSKKANSWKWDFGDQNKSVQENPVHEYDDPGTFQVTLLVTTLDGDTSTRTKEIVIDEHCRLCITPSGNFKFCGTRQEAEGYCEDCILTGGTLCEPD